MTLTERAAYLKGLREGLNLNTETPEGKLLDAVIDMLKDVALEIEDIEENAECVNDELDLIEDELDAIEEVLDDEFDDYEDEEDDDLEEVDDDEDDFDFGDEEAIYEITCPTCGEVIEVGEAVLLDGAMKCPKCGEDLEFDFDEDDAE
ncbi:MAG: hypothetical protein IKS29_02980 [Oscillospiraceae bacterium]|nr:hypothetical protein [Oscillospiraceae bacterium]